MDCICEAGNYMACEAGAAVACSSNPALFTFFCAACPVGSLCTGDSNEMKTQAGYWQPDPVPGSVQAHVDLSGIPASYAESPDGWGGEVLKWSFSRAMEALTGTGRGSVAVTSLTPSGTSAIRIAFKVTVPVTMSTAAVSSSIAAAIGSRRFAMELRRVGAAFTSALQTQLESAGATLTANLTATGYTASSTTEPVHASTQVFQCPYPKNCEAEPNQTCALGAYGPMCGLCEVGWALKTEGCVECEGSGSWAPVIALGVILVVAIVAVNLHSWCTKTDSAAEEGDEEHPEDSAATKKERKKESTLNVEAEDATAFHSDVSMDCSYNAKVEQVEKLGKNMGIDTKRLGLSQSSNSAATASSLLKTFILTVTESFKHLTAPLKVHPAQT